MQIFSSKLAFMLLFKQTNRSGQNKNIHIVPIKPKVVKPSKTSLLQVNCSKIVKSNLKRSKEVGKTTRTTTTKQGTQPQQKTTKQFKVVIVTKFSIIFTISC